MRLAKDNRCAARIVVTIVILVVERAVVDCVLVVHHCIVAMAPSHSVSSSARAQRRAQFALFVAELGEELETRSGPP